MDFTCKKYRELVVALREAGYEFLTFEEYMSRGNRTNEKKYVVLRHDVDLRAAYSGRVAKIEHEEGAKASYYFRIIPESNQPDIIRQIAELGHEIGYHYEDLSLAHGDMIRAISLFREHLAYFRSFYPIKTICMHGAPTSQYDGRDLWKEYDYHDEGVTGEPYFDMDFKHALYLTDTGRRWDGWKVSLRDKVAEQEEWSRAGLVFHTTDQLIAWIKTKGNKNLMITTHPQRWTDDPLPWLQEALVQRIKNIIKRVLIRLRGLQ